MKANVRSFAAALLAAALSFGTLPVAAQETNDSSLADSTVISDSEITSSAEDTSADTSVEESDDESSEEESSESSIEEMPIDTGDDSSASDSSSRSSSEESSDDSSDSKENAEDYIDFSKPVFDATDNTLTCTFEILKETDGLAFDLNWAGEKDGDAAIDSTPKSIKVNGSSIRITPDEKPADSDGLVSVRYAFSSEQVAALREGDKVEFVFDVYAGSENEKINTTSQVWVGKKSSTSYNMFTEQECNFEVTSEWKKVEYNYDPSAKTWTLNLTARVKPEKLDILFTSTPADLLKKDGVVVKVDNKEIKNVTVEEVKTGDDDFSSETSGNTSSKKALRVSLPDSAVEDMTDSSKIFIVFKTDADTNKKASVIADVDNGLHPVLYETGEFTITGTPKTGHNYDESKQTWTANITLQSKPSEFILTFTQTTGTCLGNVKSVTLDGKEVKPEIKETTENKNKVYTLTFSEDDVKKMDVDSKISVVFGINPPSSGSVSEVIVMNIKDGSIDKNYTAKFDAKKATGTTTGGANTATNTGLYAMIGVFAAALVALVAFFFASKKKKTN